MQNEKIFVISFYDTTRKIQNVEYLVFPFKGAYGGTVIKEVYLAHDSLESFVYKKEYMLLCLVDYVDNGRLYGRVLNCKPLENVGSF